MVVMIECLQMEYIMTASKSANVGSEIYFIFCNVLVESSRSLRTGIIIMGSVQMH